MHSAGVCMFFMISTVVAMHDTLQSSAMIPFLHCSSHATTLPPGTRNLTLLISNSWGILLGDPLSHLSSHKQEDTLFFKHCRICTSFRWVGLVACVRRFSTALLHTDRSYLQISSSLGWFTFLIVYTYALKSSSIDK